MYKKHLIAPSVAEFLIGDDSVQRLQNISKIKQHQPGPLVAENNPNSGEKSSKNKD